MLGQRQGTSEQAQAQSDQLMPHPMAMVQNQ